MQRASTTIIEHVDFLDELLQRAERALHSEPRQAAQLAGEATDLARIHDDDARLARAMRSLGDARQLLAEYPGALAAYLEAIALHPAHDRAGQAVIWHNAARTHFQMANYREALEYLEVALRLVREHGSRAHEIAILEELAATRTELGENARAQPSFSAHLSVRRSLDAGDSAAHTQLRLGMLKLHAASSAADGEARSVLYGEAGELFSVAAQTALRERQRCVYAHTLTQLGRVSLALEQPATAEATLRQALAQAEELGERHLTAHVLHLLASATEAQGDAISSLDLRLRALGHLEEIGAREDLAALHRDLSQCYERCGDLRRALRHFQQYHELDALLRAQAADGRAQAVAARLNVQHVLLEAERERSRSAELEALVLERTAQLESAHVEMLELLAGAAEFRDAPLGSHVRWVGDTSALLARALGEPEELVRALGLAARLHDIGKIGIPDGILLKNGRLDTQEWAVMQTHTLLGARMLARGATPLLQLARDIALSHHERWDGSGYPGGLAGEAIPLVGRIVSVVDTFDALVSERPYKTAWTTHEALTYLRVNAGHLFDPCVVAAFERLSASGALPLRA